MSQLDTLSRVEALRIALLEAAGHLLDAANVLQETDRAFAASLCRLAASHATRIAEAPDATAA